jgi:flagellar hook-length control protein FliK
VAAAPQASARSVIEAAVRAPESPARSSLAAGEAADEFSGRDRSPVDGPARALADGVRQAGGPGAYAPPLGGHAEPLAAGSVNNAPVTAVSGSDAAAAAAGGKRAPSAATGPATGAIQALLAAVAGNQAMAGGGGRVGADNAPASPLEARSVTLPESLQPAADRHVSMAAGRAAAATAAGAAAATQAAVGTLHDDGGTQRKALLEAGGRAIDPAGTQGAPLPGAGAGLGAMTAGVSTPAQAAADGRLAASPGSADFAPQLAAHITTLVRDGVQQARLELNPAEMGPLTVQIQLDGNAARVHLAAENAQTRAALEQAMPQLAGSLRESGLTLSGGGVFEQPRQQQAPQGGFSGSGGSPGGSPGSSANGSQRDDRGNRSGRDPAASTLPGAAGNDGATGRRRAGVVDLVA